MKYVYLLQSLSHPDHRYVGLTADIEKCLAAYNAGQSTHIAKYRPWKLVSYLAFNDKDRAAAFEKYLKSGSLRTFAEFKGVDDTYTARLHQCLDCGLELADMGEAATVQERFWQSCSAGAIIPYSRAAELTELTEMPECKDLS